MSFIETPRFPDALLSGLDGGPQFHTDEVQFRSGARVVNSVWQLPRRTFDITPIPTADRAMYLTLLNFFMATRGRAHSFRLRDPFDNADDGAGILAEGIGTGLPTYQLGKRYGLAGFYHTRPITKPYGTPTVKRNGSAVTQGAAAGNISIDTTTGVVTFVKDASFGVASITVGNPTVVTLYAVIGLSAGGLMYLSGITGTLGTLLNGKAWPVTAISGNNHTLTVNTTGLSGSGGTGYKYPQPTDALTWAGQFDTPCHFTTDEFRPQALGNGVFAFPGLGIEEDR